MRVSEKRYAVGRGAVTAALVCGVLTACGVARSKAQALASGTTLPAPLGQDCGVMEPLACVARVGQDQPMLVRSGLSEVRQHWLLTAGFAAAVAVTVHYDSRWSQMAAQGLPAMARLDGHANQTMIIAPFAASVATYFVGDLGRNAHLREAGVESAEAMVDAAIEGKALKYAINRQGDGEFWQSGTAHGAYMPSGHALNIWSFAGAMAANYPQKRVILPLLAVASATSVGRIASRAHYPADVLVGSALGWGIGRSVAAARGGRQSRLQFSGSADRHGFEAGLAIEP